jgi:hypothetical protein
VTQDVDVLVRPAAENLERLRRFLKSAEAKDRRRRSIDLVMQDLSKGGSARLNTKYGGFDVMTEIPADGDFSFDALLGRSEAMRLGRQRVRVVALDDLIAMKMRAHRAKDLMRLPELRQISELTRRRTRRR